MKLLKVIKNPVTDHLPVGCRKLGTSFTVERVVNPREIVPPEEPIAIVVGAFARGQVGSRIQIIFENKLTMFFINNPCYFIHKLLQGSVSNIIQFILCRLDT